MISQVAINHRIEYLRAKLQHLTSDAEDLTTEPLLLVSRELDEAINTYYRNKKVIVICTAYHLKSRLKLSKKRWGISRSQ